MNNRRIVIAGGSGFIGCALAEQLMNQGYAVSVLTRQPEAYRGPAGVTAVTWDGKTLGPWAQEIDGAYAVVNLAGKNVNCRYTPTNRRIINRSRVDSVLVMDQAINRCTRPPGVLVQAGSLAICGDAGERICDETAPPGDGFPVETCMLWEWAFNQGRTPNTRRVFLRISFVLGRGGGALMTLAKLTRLFLGGAVGTGRQYISWLHIKDMVRIFTRAIESPDMHGLYNATGPHSVTNAQFMRRLRRALHRPWAPPTPAPLVHLGAWLMRTDPVLALAGRRGVPRRLIESGFEFEFLHLDDALEDIFPDGRRPQLKEAWA